MKIIVTLIILTIGILGCGENDNFNKQPISGYWTQKSPIESEFSSMSDKDYQEIQIHENGISLRRFCYGKDGEQQQSYIYSPADYDLSSKMITLKHPLIHSELYQLKNGGLANCEASLTRGSGNIHFQIDGDQLTLTQLPNDTADLTGHRINFERVKVVEKNK